MPKHSLYEMYRDAVRTQYFRNDPEGALRKLERAQEFMTRTQLDDTPLLFSVPARLNLLNGKFADARANTEAGLIFFGDDADMILILAICELEDDNASHAFALVDEALDRILPQEDELKAIAHIVRGDIWGSQMNFEEQKEEYRKALEYVPRFPLAYELIGHSSLESGNYSEAREAFKKAMSFGTEVPWSALGYGIALKNTGDLRGAISEFYKVIDNYRDPKVHYRAYRQLGSCFYRKKEYTEARKHYTNALKLESRDLPTLCDLAVVCIDDGKLQDGSDFLTMALKETRNIKGRPRDVIDKGFAVLASLPSLTNTAAGILRFRITDNPLDLSFAYLVLGVLFESQHKYSDAKVMYDRVMETSPEPSHRAEAHRRLSGIAAGQGLVRTVQRDEERKKPQSAKHPYVNVSRFRKSSYRR
ncbi:MAG: hypothetical protein Kow00107_05240 [Planctomycetota bacterium]